MKAGDMIRFGYVHSTCRLNNELAIYLGEDNVHRGDGVVVYNFSVLIVGEDTPTCCDRSMFKYIRKVEA